MGENSKEEFDFEYDKIHRHGKVNGTKQKDFISQIQVASISIGFILHTEKKLKTTI